MELKPGYKQTDAGIVPVDWDVTSMETLLAGPIQNGVFNEPSRKGKGAKLINVIDLYGKFPVNTNKLELFNATQDEILRFGVRHGDVFFTRSSLTPDGIAQCNVVRTTGSETIVFDCHIIRVRTNGVKADPFFLARYCTSREARRFLVTNAKTTTMTTIDQSVIAKLPVALPSLPEQRALATALSDADALLEGLDQLIAKKRDLKQAAMQQLLNGETRLKGFSNAWTLTRLGDHVTFLSHGTNSRAELQSDGAVKYLHYGDIHASAIATLAPGSLPSLPEEKAKGLDRLHDGDLVLADASEDLAGVSKSVEICGVGETQVVAGLHTIAARFDKEILADGFKAYLQFCPAFSGQLRRLAAGTKVYATNRSHVASIEMRLPETDEQVAIAAVFRDMDAEIAALEQRRAKTADLKQAMMQELLTGRTRLV